MAYGVTIKVGAGKNVGRKLRHDFMVIGYTQHPLTATASGFMATMPMPQNVNVKASCYALVAWINVPYGPTPIQAAGWPDISPPC